MRDREAEIGKTHQLFDDLPYALAFLADIEVEQNRLLDLVVVAPDVVAVLFQYLELPVDVWTREQVAGLGVFRDEPQGLTFPGAAYQDWWVRQGRSLWGVECSRELVILPFVGLFAAAPHLQADLQRFFQPLEAFGDRIEVETETGCLVFVPCRA